ncbi:MAG: hypothetical protein AAF909_03695 [Pseudomonadota bacterium]
MGHASKKPRARRARSSAGLGASFGTKFAAKFGAKGAAILAASVLVSGLDAGRAEASEPWRYAQSRDGARAQSCGGAGAYTACATVKCGVDGQLRFALENVSPNAPVRRDGIITAPNFRDRVAWLADPSLRNGRVNIVADGVNMAALIARLKAANIFGAVINDDIKRARGEISFTLNGSSRAISRVELQCGRLAADFGRGGGFRGGRPAPLPPEPDFAAGGPWRFTNFANGARADSCGRFGRRDICATFYCAADGELRFGLDGLAERNRAARAGGITIGRFSRRATFNLEAAPGRNGAIYASNVARVDELADRARSGRELVVAVEPRERALVFSLAGSSRALGALERRCDELAAPATSPWRFTEFRRGGMAQSCGIFDGGRSGRGREICATVYCVRGSGLRFGLDGLGENRRDRRRGRVVVGGFDRSVTFGLAEGPALGDTLYQADLPRPGRFAQRLKSGSELTVAVEPRATPLSFRLTNSSRAIGRLENRCAAVAGRRGAAPPPPPVPGRRGGGDPLFARYEATMLGAWAQNNRACGLRQTWRFTSDSIVDRDGAICDLQLEGVQGNAVIASGVNCRGGQAAAGAERIFAGSRNADGALSLTVSRPDGRVRIRDGVRLRVQPGDQQFRLVRCR